MFQLEIEGLDIGYGSRRILDKISLSVAPGEIVAIVGPSGCGKTTLLNAVAGILKPNCGTIKYNGAPVKRGDFAYMFQEDRLLPWRTLLSNVSLPHEIVGRKLTATGEVVRFLAEMGLKGFEDCYPNQLSIGMRKRAALARTFFMDKQMVLLDEPLASLDFYLLLELERQIFEHLVAGEKSAIIVTHNYDTAASLADRIIVLSQQPSRVAFELQAGVGRHLSSPTKARKSEQFFNLTKQLLEVSEGVNGE